MPFALPRTRALVPVLAALVALCAAPRARAQEALGYGEDATVAPLGAIRTKFSIDWHRDALSGAGNDTMYETDRQQRVATLGLELGVLRRFSIGASVPWVVTKALTFVSSPHPQGEVLDTLLDSSHNGWGNAQAFGKLVWLGDPGQHERLALRDGVHVRSAIVGGALLGTGELLRPTDRFGIPTSDRESAIIAHSITDVTVGRHLFGSIVVRYEKPLADNVLVGLHVSDNPFAADSIPVLAHRQLGARYEVEITPRYQLGRYFAAGIQYRYRHGAQDAYTGSTTTFVNGQPVTVDASTLEAGSALTEHRIGFGVVYSAVDAYTRNQSRIPIEVTFEHQKIVSVSGNRPKDSIYTFSFRIFKRLWGAEFAPPARPKKDPTLEPATTPPAPQTP